MNRPTDHPDWNRGLPDFSKDDLPAKVLIVAVLILALGFVSGVLFMLI